MHSINNCRITKRNSHDPNTNGRYVVYWMQTSHRLSYNYALEYAVERANELNKPLLVYEELQCDYRWACERFHYFYLQGMHEHLQQTGDAGVTYVPFVEKEPGEGKHSLDHLLKKACLLVTDEYPVYFIRERNDHLSEQLAIPFITVDSNGLIPMKVSDKAPYNAYFFRREMQKLFTTCYTHPPLRDPLEQLEVTDRVSLDPPLEKFRSRSVEALQDIDSFIGGLSFPNEVPRIDQKGTRSAALGKLGQFIANGLPDYAEQRNNPDADKASGLSPWLHFGKISTHEIVSAVLAHQPEGWDPEDITYNDGTRKGFFNGDGNITEFLDELITWRELGFHFAYHNPEYDRFESLPDWARETLDKHRNDPREWIYSLEELDKAQTHDEIWNAAQRQLRQEGIIQNYLRMLWGKKVIEWTADPETALDYLIELNNRYAIDGRDPNSYSGIFWCFGRFDRAWQERPIFGKIRYMTSKSTRRKLSLDSYLNRFGSQEPLL